MQLKNLQELFVSEVVGQNFSPELKNLITPSGTLNHFEALQVYSLDYKARILEALGKNFEATWLVLGDEEFLSFANEYISENPSELTNLTPYGDHFPDFLFSKKVPLEVFQMAVFEKEYWRLFNAPLNPSIPLNEEVLQSSHFDISEIYLFESDLRLDLVWQHRESEGTLLSEINFYEKCYIALFKDFEKVEIRVLTDQAYLLLLQINKVGKITELTSNENSSNVWAGVLQVLSFAKVKR